MRAEVYTNVHKGLRARLFDLAFELGRVNADDGSELKVALAAYRRTVGFLREHHAGEAAHAEPVLASRAPQVVAANEKQHQALDAAINEMDALAASVEAGGRAMQALGDRYRAFLGSYLQHMDHEETVVQAAFWEHCTDQEIMAIHGRIQGALPPGRFSDWLEIMLPAMNLAERAGMLGGLKHHAPPPVFAVASEVAARVLGPAAWSAVRQRAQL
jgi:hypothetical protein